MKTLTIFTVLLTLGISFSSFVVSRQVPELNTQSNPAAANTLRLHRQGNGVSVSWSASPNAAKFRVERAYTEPDFFEVANELDNNGARTLRFKDENVFPGDIFYRVVSIDIYGNEQCSEIAAIKIRKHG